MANTSPGRWIYNTQRWRNLRTRILTPQPPCHWGYRGCTRRATCLDHYPIDTHRFRDGDERAWHEDYVVPACRHCNAVRAQRVRARLGRRRNRRTRRVSRQW